MKPTLKDVFMAIPIVGFGIFVLYTFGLIVWMSHGWFLLFLVVSVWCARAVGYFFERMRK